MVIDLGTASHWTPLNPKEGLKLGAKFQSVHNQWTSCTLLNQIQAVGELLQSVDSQNIGTYLVVVVFRSGCGFHHRPMACPLPCPAYLNAASLLVSSCSMLAVLQVCFPLHTVSLRPLGMKRWQLLRDKTWVGDGHSWCLATLAQPKMLSDVTV